MPDRLKKAWKVWGQTSVSTASTQEPKRMLAACIPPQDQHILFRWLWRAGLRHYPQQESRAPAQVSVHRHGSMLQTSRLQSSHDCCATTKFWGRQSPQSSLSSRRPNSSADELKIKGYWRYLCPGSLRPTHAAITNQTKQKQTKKAPGLRQGKGMCIWIPFNKQHHLISN